MKGLNHLQEAAESLKDLGKVIAKQKEAMNKAFAEMQQEFTGEDKALFQQFVKESSELVEKSGKTDFNKAMRLINEFKEKYGNLNTNK